MADGLFRNESPVEYFKDLVEAAITHQGLTAGELTSYYVVNLLAGQVSRDPAEAQDDEALGIRFVKALQAGGSRQRDGLRRVGDLSLFISGFFSDSLNYSLVDVDYYIALGERAYGSLARHSDETFSDVFDELAEKFSSFVDVLGEVSERAAMSSNTDLLRLYERWLKTRSRRQGDLLVRQGIVPDASGSTRLLQ
ncbi:MAG: hypothetical protein ACRD26_24620 [Vicinamibacterales bacterium]